ncbi:Uncharacterised protein [Paenibacillus polymyxa]|uniref:Uncharacterized protein n=1 Tax=Paenibacillus polymyxa TaxID=1406 RepID=A0A378XYF8_PAEPO|nr:hypothetical protein SAMN04488600_106142 [Paenibacillus polymyxa]SPY16583.1 Uncharacterised protein [Paenibacillus polymyxa]SUA69874.1 Uncharacterised protein [Paenibacillus polymyxa]
MAIHHLGNLERIAGRQTEFYYQKTDLTTDVSAVEARFCLAFMFLTY